MKRSEHAPVSSENGNQTGAAEKRVLVLYGSETGTAEGYAYETAARLRSFACRVSRFPVSSVHTMLMLVVVVASSQEEVLGRCRFPAFDVSRPVVDSALCVWLSCQCAPGTKTMFGRTHQGKFCTILVHVVSAVYITLK